MMNIFCRFSDYCYLLDESSGCYDTRQNRSCVVINAVSNAGAFGIANNDADMVVKDMTDVGFNVQKFPKDKDKDRTHSTLMKSIKKGNIIDYIHLDEFFQSNEPLLYCRIHHNESYKFINLSEYFGFFIHVKNVVSIFFHFNSMTM